MKKYSFRNRVVDLKLVFLSFPPGAGGNLDGAAANMTAQLKATSSKCARFEVVAEKCRDPRNSGRVRRADEGHLAGSE